MQSAESAGLSKRDRSSSFSKYEFATRSENDLALKQSNLAMSPLSSAVSGSCISYKTGRRRSETWHGAMLPSGEYSKNQDTMVSTCLKDVLHDIVMNELHCFLSSDCDLMCGEELAELSETISRTIADKAKRVVASGAKIVSCVFIGEIRDDGIEVASQCLLDQNHDVFACANHKTSSTFAVGELFVVLKQGET